MDSYTVNILKQNTQKISVQDWLNENDFSEASCGFEPLVVYADVHYFSPNESKSSQSDSDEDFLSVSQQLRRKSPRLYGKKFEENIIDFDAIEPYKENKSGDKSSDPSYTFDKIFYNDKKMTNVIKKTYAGKVKNKIKNDKRVLSSYKNLFVSKSTNSSANSVNSSRKKFESLRTGDLQRLTKDITTNKSMSLGHQIRQTSLKSKSKLTGKKKMSLKDKTINNNKTCTSDSDKLIKKTSAEVKTDGENISYECVKDCYVSVEKFDPKLYKVNINNNIVYSSSTSRESLQGKNFTCKTADSLSHGYFENVIKNNTDVEKTTSSELLQGNKVNSSNCKPVKGLSSTYFKHIIKNNPIVLLEKLEKPIADNCTYPLNNLIQSNATSRLALDNCKDITDNLQTANIRTKKKVKTKTVKKKSRMKSRFFVKRQVKNLYLNSTEKLVWDNCEQNCKRKQELSELKSTCKDNNEISIHSIKLLRSEIENNEKVNSTHEKILNTLDQLPTHENILNELNDTIKRNNNTNIKLKSEIKKKRSSFGYQECNTVSDQENNPAKIVGTEELNADIIKKIPVVPIEPLIPYVNTDRFPLVNNLNNWRVNKKHNVCNNSDLSSRNNNELVEFSSKQEKNVIVTPVKVSEQKSPGWSRLENTKKDFNLSHRIKLNVDIKSGNKAEVSSTETTKKLKTSKNIVKNLFYNNKEKTPPPISINELVKEKSLEESVHYFMETEKYSSVSHNVAEEYFTHGKQTVNLKRNLVDISFNNFRNGESEKSNMKKQKLTAETGSGHKSTLIHTENRQANIQRSASTMTMNHMVDVGIQTCLEPPYCLPLTENKSITTNCNCKSTTINDSDIIKSSSKVPANLKENKNFTDTYFGIKQLNSNFGNIHDSDFQNGYNKFLNEKVANNVKSCFSNPFESYTSCSQILSKELNYVELSKSNKCLKNILNTNNCNQIKETNINHSNVSDKSEVNEMNTEELFICSSSLGAELDYDVMIPNFNTGLSKN